MLDVPGTPQRSVPTDSSALAPEHIPPTVKDEAIPFDAAVLLRNRAFTKIVGEFTGPRFYPLGHAIMQKGRLRWVKFAHRTQWQQLAHRSSRSPLKNGCRTALG